MLVATPAIQPAWFGELAADAPRAGTRIAAAPRQEWIIQLTEEALASTPDPRAAAAVVQAALPQVQVLRGLGGRGQLLVAAPHDMSPPLDSLPEVARAEANGLVFPAAFEPNDPDYLTGSQWGLRNDGLAGGLAGAEIDAAGAWEITAGDANVVIAIIDGGIDISHPDLAPNVWRNPGEIPGNGIDDDGNGFVDDVFGWDFRNGNASVFDAGDNDHGTLVAGVAAARGGNGTGGLGVAPLARFLPLKFIGNGGGSTSDAVSALNYVTMMRGRGVGIRVANLSWGSGDSSWFLGQAIEAAGRADVLVVASAGNEGLDQDRAFFPNYPSGFDSANLLAVAATDRSDRLWASSNYGLTRVDLAAPGVAILSTVPGRSFDLRSGTSFAAPFVAGVAALAAAADPSISVTELRAAILAGVDSSAGLIGKTASGGRLNAAATVRLVKPPPPINAHPTAVSVTTRLDNLPESTDTRLPIHLADIAVSDDGQGVTSIHLEGADRDRFVVEDGRLLLTAGVELDYGQARRLRVSVVARDPTAADQPTVPPRADFVLSILNDPEHSGREYLEPEAGQILVDAGARSGPRQVVIRAAGTVVLAGSNLHRGGTRVETGTLVIRDPGALGGGRLEVLPGASATVDLGFGTAAVSALELAVGGRIELGAGGIAIAAGAEESTVRAAIQSGRGQGDWAGGSGITSEIVAAAAGTMAIGYRVSGDGSAVVMSTALGDVDLDSDVDLFDLLAIANGGGLSVGHSARWSDGDVDYDGRVTLFDLLAISTSGRYGAGSIRPPVQPPVGGEGGMAAVAGSTARLQAFARLAKGLSWESAAVADEDERGGADSLRPQQAHQTR